MKKLLLFLLLVAAGFAALIWLAGDAPLPKAPMLTGGGERPAAGQQAPPSGVVVQQGSLPATFTQTGPLELVRWRSIPEADGRTRKEEAFVLQAADSRPLGEGRQQLDGVVVRLFDGPKHAATLTAKQAFVALQPDANGKPSVDERKDIDLRELVLAAQPGSRLAGFRLQLGAATVRVGDDEVTLTAPDAEPVLAELAGDRPLTLRGFGLRAVLPRAPDGALVRADVTVVREPVAEADGMTVRARGALRFVDDAAAGAAELSLQDDVALTSDRAFALASGGARAPTGGLAVRGDRFVGWLLRHKEGDRQQMAWRRIELTGAPATVTLPEGRLATPRLTGLPNLYGELAWLTAHGGTSRLEQTSPRQGRAADDLLVGTSERRIHFVEPRGVTAAHLRSFGFRRWQLRPIEQLQAVVVEGRATVADKTSTCTAQDGARLYRRDGGDGALVRGLGAVRVTQAAARAGGPDLAAEGSDGFTLRSRSDGTQLRLGPDGDPTTAGGAAAAAHAFALRHGTARVVGNGVVDLDRRGDETGVQVVAPDASLAVTLPDDGLTLRAVHRVDARIVGERPVALDVAGWPADIEIARGDERVVARAPRLQQIGPSSLRLLAADPARPAVWSGLRSVQDRTPTLRRTVAAGVGRDAQEIEVRGPSIDVHHAGGRSAIVDAVEVGDESPQVYARLATRPGQQPSTLACVAQRLRLLPFATPPAFAARLLGDGSALGHALFRGAGSPWLVVDDVREFQFDDPQQGHVEGRGRRLLVSQGGRAALFVGDADAQQPAEVVRVHAGRRTTLRGARVRIVDDVEVRLDALGAFVDRETFLPPTLTLHEAQRTGLLAHMQATCQGDIAVREQEVAFGGPVAVRGLLPDDTPDPQGVVLDARTLRLQRNVDGGEVIAAKAGDVTAAWSDVQATCAALDLDLRWSRLVAADPADAIVTLRDGRELRSPRIEVNYATQSARMSSGRMAQRRADGDAR